MVNEKIRVLMFKKQMTFDKLSEKTGIKRSTLHLHLTSGDIFEEARKIADALDVQLKDII